MPGALPVGRNSPQRPPLRALCRADFRHRLHRAARTRTAAPGPTASGPRWCTSPMRASTTALMRTRAVQRRRGDAVAAALEPVPDPARRRPTSSRASSPSAATATPPTQTGMAVHVYAANRSMTDRYFYNADGEMLIVPQQGRAALRHRARRARGRARRDRGDPARPALPGRTAGRPVARLHLRELRPDVPAAGARPARLQRARQSARLPRAGRGLSRTRRRRARWSPSSRAICGRRRWSIRRSTWSPGTAISRPTNTISRASW